MKIICSCFTTCTCEIWEIWIDLLFHVNCRFRIMFNGFLDLPVKKLWFPLLSWYRCMNLIHLLIILSENCWLCQYLWICLGGHCVYKVIHHFCSRIGEWSDWPFVAWTWGRAKLIIFPFCGGTGSKFGCWRTVPPVISHISFWSLITLHTWLFWWRVWYFQWPGSQLAIHQNGKQI